MVAKLNILFYTCKRFLNFLQKQDKLAEEYDVSLTVAVLVDNMAKFVDLAEY